MQYKNISLLEKSVLKSLRKFEGQACPIDLINSTGLTEQDIYVALNALNKKGLILSKTHCFHLI
jgi:DNA-binding MarR family transcriptional regulator